MVQTISIQHIVSFTKECFDLNNSVFTSILKVGNKESIFTTNLHGFYILSWTEPPPKTVVDYLHENEAA